MEEIVRKYSAGELDRAGVRARTARKTTKQKRGRRKHFRFEVSEKELPFRLSMTFKKPEADKEEIIEALQMILDRLRREEGS